MDISRTPGQAAHATNDEIFVCRQLIGSLALEQNEVQLYVRVFLNCFVASVYGILHYGNVGEP